MDIKTKIVNKLDSFLEMVLESISAEKEMLKVALKSTTKTNTKALELMIKMQEVNSDRIKSLYSYINVMKTKFETVMKPRILRKKVNAENISIKLIEKYEDLAQIATDKKIQSIGEMFDD